MELRKFPPQAPDFYTQPTVLYYISYLYGDQILAILHPCDLTSVALRQFAVYSSAIFNCLHIFVDSGLKCVWRRNDSMGLTILTSGIIKRDCT